MGKVKHRGSHSGIEAKKHLGQHFLNDENVAISTAELIEGEDKSKPLTDEKLGKLLKEKGYKVARRTVAKYREQLDLPVARLRKSLK